LFVAVACAILIIPTICSAQQIRAASAQQQTLNDAATLLQAGRLEEAEAAVRAYLRVSPRDASGHTLLGVVLDQRGRETEAEQSYNTALKLDPKMPGALFGRGVARQMIGEGGWKSSIEAATALKPTIAEDFVRFGLKADLKSLN
jgi:cytochrome c-type biogenesis protein CcmH/NrfG